MDFEEFQSLSTLTKMPVEDLYSASSHQFAEIVGHTDHNLGSMYLESGEIKLIASRYILKHYVWSHRRLAFCPLCLKQSSYHRLIWMPMAAPACVDHQCLLENRCLKCGKSVMIEDIVGGVCTRCGFDLRKTPLTRLTEDSFGLDAQRIIQAWLRGISPNKELRKKYGLPDRSGPVLFGVLDGLNRAIKKIRHSWDYLHKSTFDDDDFFPYSGGLSDEGPDQTYLLFTTAFKGLVDWPRGFYEFLDAYLKRADYQEAEANESLSKFVGQIFYKYWNEPEFQFLHNAFDNYLMRNSKGVGKIIASRLDRSTFLRNKFNFMSQNEVQRDLAISRGILNMLKQKGVLADYRQVADQDSALRRVLIRKSDVKDLKQMKKEGVPLWLAAQIIGTTNAVVESLIKHNLIRLVGENYFGLIEYNSIVDFLEKLSGSVRKFYQARHPRRPINFMEVTNSPLGKL